MAQVFISYSRKDVKKVRPLVRRLKNAGLEVWWDSRLTGGAEFTTEIEQALENSQAVVVLWSINSFKSPWVLDEAARGRDRGKLIPATLDGTEPPIGFGQLHTIDLKARRPGAPRPADDLVKAVVDKIKAGGGEIGDASPAWGLPDLDRRWFVVGGAGLIGAVAMGFWLSGGFGQPDVNDRGKVTVAAIETLNSVPSERFAAQATTQAIERTFANNRIITLAGEDKNADFGLRGTVASRNGAIILDADVIDPDTNRILWSTQFSRDDDEVEALADQVAVRLADILRCSVYTLRRMPKYDGAELHSRVLSYCEAERSAGEKYGELVDLSKALIEVAPKSAQAWAYLANALSFTRVEDLEATRAAVKRALQLDPDNGTVRWAMATMDDRSIPLAERERLVREGMALDPENIWFKNNLANIMRVTGQKTEAFRYWKEFVDDYPLDYHQRSVLAYLAMENGFRRQGREMFEAIERVRPERRNHKRHAMRAEALFGDPGRARQWAAKIELEDDDRDCLDMAIAIVHRGVRPSAGDIERRCVETGATFFAEELLILAGHADEAIALLGKSIKNFNALARFGPDFVYQRGFEAIRRDPRLIDLLARIDVAQYWLETGKFADFCSQEDLPYDCRTEARRAVAALKKQERS